MKVLITGASGFVGPYLIDELKKRIPEVSLFGTYYAHHEYDLIEKAKPYYLDLNDKKNIDAILYDIKPDWIIHLAAQSSGSLSWKNPGLTFNINVNGTINLFESVKEFSRDSRILLVGSSEQYGIVGSDPISEEQILKPMNPYGISKMTQEELGRLYVKAYGLDIVFTRSFNHIGPKQEPTFVVSDWCKQIAMIESGMAVPGINVGNIQVKRDFSHVRDVVNSYIDILENGEKGEVYNVGSGNAISLREVLDILLSFSEKEILINIDKDKLRPAENEIIVCNRNKLDKISNKKYISIKDALQEVLDYWRDKVKQTVL